MGVIAAEGTSVLHRRRARLHSDEGPRHEYLVIDVGGTHVKIIATGQKENAHGLRARR